MRRRRPVHDRFVRAFDRKTGARRWTFYTVPHDPRRGPQEKPYLDAALKTWDPQTDWSYGGGGTVWDGMEPTVVPGTAGATALSIGSMGCSGCTLGAGGVVSCWGCNGSSQLGDATTTPSSTAVRAMGVPAATSISLGQAHACALTATGDVWCWGGNTSGQLGIGSGLPSSPPAQVVSL